MPVDTTQTFVLIEGARTTCEGMVVEELLIEREQLLCLLWGDVLVAALDSTQEEVGIVEVRREVYPTLTILREDVGGVICQEALYDRQRQCFSRQIVHI